MRLTRRAALTLLSCLAVRPLPALAADCEPLVPGLLICHPEGWQIDNRQGPTATLTHASGITASVTLRQGRSEEEMTWDGWQAAHAPISARALVLETELIDILGRSGVTTAYLPRHLKPATVIVLSTAQGDGLSLSVSTSTPGRAFSDPHRQAHAALLQALKLDPSE